MKRILVALIVLPLTAFAQGGPPPGGGPGPGAHGRGPGRGDPERMERRLRLARTLGLAEALDLDAPQALKLGEAVAKFDERRLAVHRQLRESRLVLKRAAQGDKAALADVDQAMQRSLDAHAQLQAIDREVLLAVTKELTPEKKARAILFLDRFSRRFGPGPGPGPEMGPSEGGGPAMMRRSGRGMNGPGAGMGPPPAPGAMMGMGAGGPEEPEDDDF